jgi:hypothetical protein
MNALAVLLARVMAEQELPVQPGDELRFEHVLEIADMAGVPDSGEALREAAEQPGFEAFFQEAYLPRISAAELRRAEGDVEPPFVTFIPQPGREWVSAVQGPSGDAVTLPEDSLMLPQLSLFTRVHGSVGRVSAEVNERGGLAGVSVRAGGHCGYPDRLKCDPGTCGTCRLELREVGPRGWVCICSHQQ